MDLGLIIGYWPPTGPPPEAAQQIATAERLGSAEHLVLGGLRLRQLHAPCLVGRRHRADPARHGHHPDLGSHAGGHGHDGHHDGPPDAAAGSSSGWA